MINQGYNPIFKVFGPNGCHKATLAENFSIESPVFVELVRVVIPLHLVFMLPGFYTVPYSSTILLGIHVAVMSLDVGTPPTRPGGMRAALKSADPRPAS